MFEPVVVVILFCCNIFQFDLHSGNLLQILPMLQGYTKNIVNCQYNNAFPEYASLRQVVRFIVKVNMQSLYKKYFFKSSIAFRGYELDKLRVKV